MDCKDQPFRAVWQQPLLPAILLKTSFSSCIAIAICLLVWHSCMKFIAALLEPVQNPFWNMTNMGAGLVLNEEQLTEFL